MVPSSAPPEREAEVYGSASGRRGSGSRDPIVRHRDYASTARQGHPERVEGTASRRRGRGSESAGSKRRFYGIAGMPGRGRAAANSSMLTNRSSGDFASARLIAPSTANGTLAPDRLADGMGACKMFMPSSRRDRPSYGGSPVSIS